MKVKVGDIFRGGLVVEVHEDGGFTSIPIEIWHENKAELKGNPNIWGKKRANYMRLLKEAGLDE